MADEVRYSFRPVVLCSVLAISGLLLLGLGLALVMTLQQLQMLLGVLVLIVVGVLFVGVYVLSRCAEIIDAQGVRCREIAGDWREVRWTDAVSVTRRHVPRSGRKGGYTMLVIRDCKGETVEVFCNERTAELVGRYAPVAIDD
ncbi:MAG: hypothetical protein IJE07_10870 [Clostridia bacterium]|nr:hypothetical protein [Clostridia bacterium]